MSMAGYHNDFTTVNLDGDVVEPAWLDQPITIPLSEYVRLRVIEAQSGADAACEKARADAEAANRLWVDAYSRAENAEAECRRLNKLLDERGD